MLRYRNGRPTALPYRVVRQLVAARLGQLPATIDEQPADDVLDAAALLDVTGLLTAAPDE